MLINIMKYIKTSSMCVALFMAVQGQASAFDLREKIANALESEGAASTVEVRNATALSGGEQAQTIDVLERELRHLPVEVAAVDFDRDDYSFNASIKVATDKPYYVEVFGRYREMVRLPVLAARHSRGATIAKAQVSWRELPAHTLRADTLLDLEELIGQELTRSIAAGQPIRTRDVQPQRLVTKGEYVAAYFRTPFIELRANAEAMEAGAAGDVIRIRNAESGQVVHAMVLRAGEVVVNFEEAKEALSTAGNEMKGGDHAS